MEIIRRFSKKQQWKKAWNKAGWKLNSKSERRNPISALGLPSFQTGTSRHALLLEEML